MSVILCVEHLFFPARNHSLSSLFSSTKQVTFHAYMTYQTDKIASANIHRSQQLPTLYNDLLHF